MGKTTVGLLLALTATVPAWAGDLSVNCHHTPSGDVQCFGSELQSPEGAADAAFGRATRGLSWPTSQQVATPTYFTPSPLPSVEPVFSPSRSPYGHPGRWNGILSGLSQVLQQQQAAQPQIIYVAPEPVPQRVTIVFRCPIDGELYNWGGTSEEYVQMAIDGAPNCPKHPKAKLQLKQ